MFKGSHHLKLHVYTHTDAKLHICSHCSESFRGHNQLKAHLLKSHNEGTWFTCHICQKNLTYHGSLREHLLHHESLKPYVCGDCPMRFFTAREVKIHQPKHSDFKRFCCGSCGKYFKRSACVVKHFNKCSVKLGYVNVFIKQD